MGSLLREIYAHLLYAHWLRVSILPSMPGKGFVCTITGAELEQECVRSLAVGLVFPICIFSYLPSSDTCSVSIPYTQGRLLLFTPTHRCRVFHLKKKKKRNKKKHVSILSVCLLHYHCWPRQFLIRFIIYSHRTWGFGHSPSCLLRILNLADSKRTDCLWRIKFVLFKSTFAQWW